MRRVAGSVDQPQKRGKQRKNDDKEKHGEEPHLLLVRGRIALAPVVSLLEHAASYCEPA
jgi:NAD(P)H-flavin reductase